MHLVESPFKRTCSIFKSGTNQQLIKGFKGTIEGKSYQECTFKSGEFDDEDIDDDVEEEEDAETPQPCSVYDVEEEEEDVETPLQ